jgi:hypothetical protein
MPLAIAVPSIFVAVIVVALAENSRFAGAVNKPLAGGAFKDLLVYCRQLKDRVRAAGVIRAAPHQFGVRVLSARAAEEDVRVAVCVRLLPEYDDRDLML